jgi:putative ABC transport system permease protein
MFENALRPIGIPYWLDFSMDKVAFGYLFAICVFTFADRLVERLGAMPDLESFTMASHIPGGGASRAPLKLEDRDVADRNGTPPSILRVVIEPGYFRALGLGVRRGREFTAIDGQAGTEAAIVNQRFAAQYWSGEDPIGKRIQLASGPWATVVGVSPTIIQVGFDPDAEAMAYLPYRQAPVPYYNILVRTRASKEVVAKTLREEIRKLDSELPLFDIRTVTEAMRNRTVRTRILGLLFSIFAIIGLILATVGIYAVTAYSTSQRTQEIGVRIALGANNRDVLRLVLRSGFNQLAIALPVGLVCAFGVTRVLTIALFQVTPLDPATFVSIPILLSVIVLVACLLPAWRAARLNPVEALRTE